MSDLVMVDSVQLAGLSTADLKQALASSIEMTAKHLMHMAMIWKELEQRGEDLSALRQGIVAYIPMIAHDRLDARVVLQFAGQKTLLAALSRLSIHEQRKVLDTGVVPALRIEGGQAVEKSLPLGSLAAAEVHLIFDDAGVRSIEDQRVLLASRLGREIKKKKKKEKAYRTVRKATVEDGRLVIGGMAMDAAKVAELLRAAGY